MAARRLLEVVPRHVVQQRRSFASQKAIEVVAKSFHPFDNVEIAGIASLVPVEVNVMKARSRPVRPNSGSPMIDPNAANP